MIDFEKIIKELTKDHATVASRSEEYKSSFSQSEILRLFHTYWLGTPRQTGKSQAMFDLVEKTPNSVLVVYHGQLATLAKERASRSDNPPLILTIKELMAMGTNLPDANTNWDLVVFDDADITVEKYKRQKIFSVLEPLVSPDVTILMMTN